jgi:hypothetical protein
MKLLRRLKSFLSVSEVSTGSGSDRVGEMWLLYRNDIKAEISVTRSLPLPVLTSIRKIALRIE